MPNGPACTITLIIQLYVSSYVMVTKQIYYLHKTSCMLRLSYFHSVTCLKCKYISQRDKFKDYSIGDVTSDGMNGEGVNLHCA